MARNGSGNYTAPSSTWNPAIPGTTILSDDWNALLSDLSTAITNSIASDGQTTTTLAIPFAQGMRVGTGSLGAPSFGVIGDTDTGIYFPSANTGALVAGGVVAASWNASGFSIVGTQTLTGLTVTGNTSLGDAAGDTLTVTATSTFESPATFNDPATFTDTVTVPDASFTNAKLANMATLTIKGRVTAGTGVPEDLTATQATTILNAVVGDSGSGGTKGLVPAPAAGDTAAAKFLSAAGTWAAASPVGSIIMHGANTPPTGWLECNGAAVSRTTYAALFAVVTTTFGSGDGSTTFNVPDMRGYFPRGWDNGRGIDPARVFGDSQNDSIESHTHLISPPTAAGEAGQGATTTGTLGGGETVTPYSSGATGDTETRPFNVALLFIIKF
jgi:microcystin-dependent protein